jgi:ligand-binding sensor domain-containing protein
MLLNAFLQAEPYTNQALSLEAGLSQSTAFSMAQDSSGFWWFGTQDGLNRYDGYAFEAFKHEPFDTTSLADNQVSALLVDEQNRLWVGFGFHGIDLYQPETNTFIHFNAENTGLSADLITCMEDGRDGSIWVGTSEGINRLWLQDNGQCTINRYFVKADSGKKTSQYIRSLHMDRQGILYVGTYLGFGVFSEEEKAIIPISIEAEEDESLPQYFRGASAIPEDKLGNLWVGKGTKLFLWDRKKDEWIPFWSEKQSKAETFFYSDIECAANGNLWISTMGQGVLMRPWDADKKQFQELWYHFSRSQGRRVHLSSDDVRTLAPDRLNPQIVWLGHATAGVEKLVRRTAVFSSFDLKQKGLEKLGTRFVSDIVTDTSGGLWIGTNRGLVYEKNMRFSQVDPEVLPSEERYISGLTRGPDGRIWLVTPQGMGELIVEKDGKPRIRLCFTNASPRMIHCLASDRDGFIYFALGNKFFVYDPDEDALSGPTLLPNADGQSRTGYQVYTVLRDSRDRLWLGTTKGLIMWSGINNPMENLEQRPARFFSHNPEKRTSLRNQIVLSMLEDQERNIWIGTGSGLHLLREAGDEMYFEAYTEKDGLANNFIYGMLENLNDQELWLSTNNGLSRFSLKKGQFENYDTGDGLQSNEFNSHAYFREPLSGEMFFGGIDGFTRFFPTEIEKDSIAPKVSITAISLPGAAKRPLLQRDNDEPIKLDFKNNSFSVHFIGLNYTQPERNQYRYKLRGLSDSWIHCGPTRQVNFSNLPPGEYTFEVTSANSDGLWSPISDSLSIYIKPPFYRTIWFVLLLALGFFLLMLGAHRLRLRDKVRRVMEMERVRKNAAADFHDELGHKLTVIALSGEIAKQKLADRPEALPQLNKIIANAHSLYYAMKDLLWVLDPSKDAVYDLALLLKDFGDELFDKTGIAFHVEGLRPHAMQNRQLAMDQKRHIALMFKEAMHNALKHSGCTEACLNVTLQGDSLLLSFTDNGKGFDASSLPDAGNGLLNMRTRAETIGAAFGIDSGPQGTTVHVQCAL